MKWPLCLSVLLCKVLEDHPHHFSCCCIHSLVTISHILSHSGEESWIEKKMKFLKILHIPWHTFYDSTFNTAGAFLYINFYKYLNVISFPKITTIFLNVIFFPKITTIFLVQVEHQLEFHILKEYMHISLFWSNFDETFPKGLEDP